MMELKEAIRRAEIDLKPPVHPMDWFPTIFEAAKRDLARSESERPKRASLTYLEANLRKLALLDDAQQRTGDEKIHVECADILKALREVVVPNLRKIEDLAEDVKFGPGVMLAGQSLDSLGEDSA